jgi:hypothetical protein
MLDLDAYAADCLVRGTVEVGDGRLSDRLEGVETLLIQAVELEDLGDGHVVSMPQIEVASDELCAIVPHGDRGDIKRRLHTRTTHVKVEVGPYLVDGTVHGTPASEPISASLRRTGWVPVTDATVMYIRQGSEVSDEVDTLLVNRTLIHSMRAADKKPAHIADPSAQPGATAQPGASAQPAAPAAAGPQPAGSESGTPAS